MIDQISPKNLTDLALDLRDLYRELHSHKWIKQVREVRVMVPAPGPQAPVPPWITSLDEELTRKLQPLVAEAAGYIDRSVSIWPHGATMCEWIADHAEQAAELSVADALIEEMEEQVDEISGRLKNLPGAQPAEERDKGEPWQLPAVIIQRAKEQGHVLSRYQLRQWSSRGYINTMRRGAHATYLESEVMQRLNAED